MVAVQVRDVPDEVRAALSVEADRRGVSLQVYLLSVLTREAAAARNRRLLADWASRPLVGPQVVVDAAALVRAERHRRDESLSPQRRATER